MWPTGKRCLVWLKNMVEQFSVYQCLLVENGGQTSILSMVVDVYQCFLVEKWAETHPHWMVYQCLYNVHQRLLAHEPHFTLNCMVGQCWSSFFDVLVLKWPMNIHEIGGDPPVFMTSDCRCRKVGTRDATGPSGTVFVQPMSFLAAGYVPLVTTSSRTMKFDHLDLIYTMQIKSCKLMLLSNVQNDTTGWWFGTWILFFHILGIGNNK